MRNRRYDNIDLTKRDRLTYPIKKFLSVDDMEFYNSDERYFMGEGLFRGPFAADNPAIVKIGGIPFLMMERGATCDFTYSETFRAAISNWQNTNVDVTDDVVGSPIGDSTADLVVENTSDSTHVLRQYFTPDGSSRYVFSCFIKPAGRTKCQLAISGNGFVGTPNTTFDLADEDVFSTSDCDFYDILSLSNGWHFIYVAATSDIASSSNFRIHLIDDSGNVSYEGDDESGVYVWGANLTVGNWPSSYIKTVASTEARDPSEAYWSEADVETWARQKFAVRLIPHYSSDQIGESHYICQWNDSGGDYDFYIDSSARFNVDGPGGNIIQSAAQAWDGRNSLIATLETDNGSNSILRVHGLNGGYLEEIGSSFTINNGGLQWGMDSSIANHWDGLISPPYRI